MYCGKEEVGKCVDRQENMLYSHILHNDVSISMDRIYDGGPIKL